MKRVSASSVHVKPVCTYTRYLNLLLTDCNADRMRWLGKSGGKRKWPCYKLVGARHTGPGSHKEPGEKAPSQEEKCKPDMNTVIGVDTDITAMLDVHRSGRFGPPRLGTNLPTPPLAASLTSRTATSCPHGVVPAALVRVRTPERGMPTSRPLQEEDRERARIAAR